MVSVSSLMLENPLSGYHFREIPPHRVKSPKSGQARTPGFWHGAYPTVTADEEIPRSYYHLGSGWAPQFPCRNSYIVLSFQFPLFDVLHPLSSEDSSHGGIWGFPRLPPPAKTARPFLLGVGAAGEPAFWSGRVQTLGSRKLQILFEDHLERSNPPLEKPVVIGYAYTTAGLLIQLHIAGGVPVRPSYWLIWEAVQWKARVYAVLMGWIFPTPVFPVKAQGLPDKRPDLLHPFPSLTRYHKHRISHLTVNVRHRGWVFQVAFGRTMARGDILAFGNGQPSLSTQKVGERFHGRTTTSASRSKLALAGGLSCFPGGGSPQPGLSFPRFSLQLHPGPPPGAGFPCLRNRPRARLPFHLLPPRFPCK